MVVPFGSGDLYHRYRPRKFSEVAGHKTIMKSIKQAVTAKSPSRAFLLIGESGTGKTTTARIMAQALNCMERAEDGEPCGDCVSCVNIKLGKSPDLVEINSADHRGIGDIRSLCSTMSLMPACSENKIYILDEAHQLTNDAQSSLLKELEEAPQHVFIILCSTHPQKLLPTVKNRCQQFKFTGLKKAEMRALLEEVATFEGESFSPAIYDAVSDAALGSPRHGLVLLQQVIQLEDRELSAILSLLKNEELEEPNVFKICLSLERNPKWSALASLWESSAHVGPTGVGLMIGGYFRNKLLKSGSQKDANKYAAILELFSSPFPEGKIGENVFVSSLYKAFVISSES